jgi:glycosyltransferase involved in cell wall biosynthesis
MNKIKVLMLGESLDRQGGIVSVEKLIIQKAPVEIEISHLSTLPNGAAISKILVFVQALGVLFWRLFKQEADIVHIHVSERGSAFRQAFTTMIAWLLRKPIILHAHSADFHLFYANLPSIIKIGLSWAFCKSTRFIVLSDSWKKFYINNLGLKAEQVIVLPNPVKFPLEISQQLNSKKVNFLFLGRIGDRKGAFDLIKAFAAISPDKKQDTSLIIAGDGEGKRARDMIAELNLSQYIKILDWVDEKQRDELLAKSDVFILPSYNEGLPMALLEAMSWELAVITTPVGGIPELIVDHDNGLLVKPGCISDLSLAIESLISNQELRRKLSKNARESVKPFNVNNYMISLVGIYQVLLINHNQS